MAPKEYNLLPSFFGRAMCQVHTALGIRSIQGFGVGLGGCEGPVPKVSFDLTLYF